MLNETLKKDDMGRLAVKEAVTLRNGYPWIPKEHRRKILLLSDDLRMPSGIGTMSREFVLGTCHYYNWVQVGAAINHPELGKKFDLSQSLETEFGVKDPSVMLYPQDGYGDENLIRYLMMTEKPDAILHYTDPRFWGWLYQIEHELRQEIPIYYYSVWDDLPYPKWNEPFYESCDLIMNISKQTYGIINHVWAKHPPADWQSTYIPHGINEDIFYPIRVTDNDNTLKQIEKAEDGKEVETEVIKKDSEMLELMKHTLFGEDIPDFVILYVNRNIRRKLPGDVILAYKEFCDSLTPEQAKKCALLMHTQPVDDNGTDLPVVAKELCPYRVVFSANRLDPGNMKLVYNIANITLNLASNEGFGLGTCESMMSGTPIMVNVTGGLQDQCGFKLDGQFLTHKDYVEIGSLHDRDIWKDNPRLTYGEWVFPVWPSNRSLQGSPATPYIFDDRPSFKEAGQILKHAYDLGLDELKRRGLLAREFTMIPEVGMAASEMSRRFIQDMESGFANWTPRKRFTLFNT